MATVVDARTTKIASAEAWDLLREASSLTTAKGEKVRTWKPQSDDKEEILRQVMGPGGNLRAPTLRLNEGEWIVGFNAGLYNARLQRK